MTLVLEWQRDTTVHLYPLATHSVLNECCVVLLSAIIQLYQKSLNTISTQWRTNSHVTICYHLILNSLG